MMSGRSRQRCRAIRRSLGTLRKWTTSEDVSFEFHTERRCSDIPLYIESYKIAADGQEEDRKTVLCEYYGKAGSRRVTHRNNKDNKDTDEGKDTGIMAKEQAAVLTHLTRVPDAGGYSNGEAAVQRRRFRWRLQMEVQHSGDGSVPRVIVTGFSTDPAEVRAGSNFKLTIHLKNTSKMKVSNMLFDLAAPTEGSDEQSTSPAFLTIIRCKLHLSGQYCSKRNSRYQHRTECQGRSAYRNHTVWIFL